MEDNSLDPTKQIQLIFKEEENFSQQFIFDSLIKISNKLPKEYYVIAITTNRENIFEFFITLNKTKSAVYFYDFLHNFPLRQNIKEINFVAKEFGNFDKKQNLESTKHILITNCFKASIIDKEIFAIEEIQNQILIILEKHQQETKFFVSLSKNFVYISTDSADSCDVIYKEVSSKEFATSCESDFLNNKNWKIQKIGFAKIEFFSETKSSEVLNCATENYKKVPGLKFSEEILSAQEETEIIDWIDREDEKYWQKGQEGKIKPMNRRVQHYGYKFNYATLLIDDIDDADKNKIPEVFTGLLHRLLDEQIITKLPNQLTINEYYPGDGILSHIDTHSVFEDEITSVSLLSPIGMEFSHASSEKRKKIPVYLPNRSVFVLTEDARYSWKHGITKKSTDNVVIPPSSPSVNEFVPTANYPSKWSTLFLELFPIVKTVKRQRRISLTFRCINASKVCTCQFPEFCDSQKPPEALPEEPAPPAEIALNELLKNNEEAEKLGRELEKKHVVEFYQTAAEHFSNTRHSPWPKISKFLHHESSGCPPEDMQDFHGIQDGMLVADIGCGNGKYLRCIPKCIYTVGTDISSNLLEQANQLGVNKHDLFVADGLSLPFRSELFDVVICIAVFHHISTLSRRLQLASELERILKPGGRILVYAWAFEQNQSEVGSRAFPAQDCFVPWHLTSKTKKAVEPQLLQRFCHVFVEGELDQLFVSASNGRLSVVDSYNDHSNWAIICRKQL